MTKLAPGPETRLSAAGRDGGEGVARGRFCATRHPHHDRHTIEARRQHRGLARRDLERQAGAADRLLRVRQSGRDHQDEHRQGQNPYHRHQRRSGDGV